MSGITFSIKGVGLLGPGLPSWALGKDVLRGAAPYVATPAVLAPPARLPPAERRRAGPSIRLAMAVADDAVAHAGVDPQRLATVFTSSGGEGGNCHALCETLASADRHISPTRFTNSVHNAAAGYWHIAVASRAASTSLSAFDGSFSAGLIEAALQVGTTRAPVLLVACDVPYPMPLHALRPLPHHLGIALLLAPADATPALARITIDLVDATRANPPDRCADAGLEALRTGVPAAAGLPLLAALAKGVARSALVLEYLPALQLRMTVESAAGPA